MQKFKLKFIVVVFQTVLSTIISPNVPSNNNLQVDSSSLMVSTCRRLALRVGSLLGSKIIVNMSTAQRVRGVTSLKPKIKTY